MTYHGHVKNGVVVLDEAAELPEGAEVRVDVLPSAPGNTANPRGIMKFAGVLKDLPEDASENVDHYLYGHEKR